MSRATTVSRAWRAGVLIATVAVGTLTFSAPPAGAVVGDPAADGSYAYTTRLAIGDSVRACTGALVDRCGVITAASCFADDPAQAPALPAGAPKWNTTTIGRADLTTDAGETVDIAEPVPRPSRDLVMSRLTTPVDGITPQLVAAATIGDTTRLFAIGSANNIWTADRKADGS
ncbi:trypsin-like serine protease [Kitasatospora sp. NPDC058397]|uniref:trypsin-like serine protease n=1 Tax=unclassified Kitasatospora TaxID=2633591 RepID=UPI00365C1684